MDKLNLTPQERRLVAGVGLIVFIVLNVWLIWPHFGDWRKIQHDREKAERTLARYQKEVDRVKSYETQRKRLESLGSSVVAEEQDIDLATTVQIQSQLSKVELTDNRDARSSSTVTNQFFDEKARAIKFRADTEGLVAFLTNLTSTNSLIRIRDMTVRPEPPNNPTKLVGDITLVASYQKKPSTNAPAARPATATVADSTVPKAAKGSNETKRSAMMTTAKPKPKATNVTNTATTNTNKFGTAKPTAPSKPKS